MYEEIAWKNFLKTGSVESFMEYKKLSSLNNDINNNISEKKQNEKEQSDNLLWN